MRTLQPAAVVHEPSQQVVGRSVGRAGHHVERAAGESEVAGVGPHQRQFGAEAFPELRGSTGVDLDGDDARAGREQGRGERAGAGADVEDEVARSDACVVDESFSPDRIELVPAPPLDPPGRWPAHGGGPS